MSARQEEARTRFRKAKAFAKFLYERQSMGPTLIYRELRALVNSKLLEREEVPGPDLIKVWARDWTRGVVEPAPWDFLDALPQEREVIGRYLYHEAVTVVPTMSRVRTPTGDLVMPSMPPPESVWPSADIAAWFIAFAGLVADPRRDGELVWRARAASRDAEYGRQMAAAYMVEAATAEHARVWGLSDEKESNDGR
jgi:hypothetical protein